jgi:hypothetical protein
MLMRLHLFQSGTIVTAFRESVILLQLTRELTRQRLFSSATFMILHFPKLLRLRMGGHVPGTEGAQLSPFLYVMQ